MQANELDSSGSSNAQDGSGREARQDQRSSSHADRILSEQTLLMTKKAYEYAIGLDNFTISQTTRLSMIESDHASEATLVRPYPTLLLESTIKEEPEIINGLVRLIFIKLLIT